MCVRSSMAEIGGQEFCRSTRFIKPQKSFYKHIINREFIDLYISIFQTKIERFSVFNLEGKLSANN